MFIPLLQLFLAMLSIQTGAGVAKSLFPLTGAAAAASLRLSFAALILIFLWRPWRYKFSKTQRMHLILYGSSLGLMNLSFYFALERIPLGLAVTLEFMGPLVLSMLSSRKPSDFLWAILSGVSIFLLMPQKDISHSNDLIGILFALTAGLFWALYIVFGKKAGEYLGGGIAACIGMIIAALVVLPFGLSLNPSGLLNISVLPLALGVAILSSALPYSLEMIALKKIPTKTFSILMCLEPAIATLIGFFMLQESLSIMQMIAIGCVMMASLGSTLSSES